MIFPPQGTIEKFAKEVWKDDYDRYTRPTIEVEVREPEWVRIKLSRMYDAPGLTFQHLTKLSEFFGTIHINDPDYFSNGGCDTCDYGSSYGFTLEIRPDK
jgi:hypothetical protein